MFFPRNVLSRVNPRLPTGGLTTRQDIVRERSSGPPTSLAKSVSELILQQLSDQVVSADRVAFSMGTSVRSLQRQLAEEGTSFRELINDVCIQRAHELLCLKTSSITEIATSLGYTSPTNFSRAFTTHFGSSPKHFGKRFTDFAGTKESLLLMKAIPPRTF